jgi:hypothetical protein
VRESDYPCKISGVAVNKAVITPTLNGEELQVEVSLALVGEVEGTMMTFGTAPPVRSNWPESVIEAAKVLIEELEVHLVGMVFEEEGNANPAIHARTDNIPPGLIGSGLETDEEDLEQL